MSETPKMVRLQGVVQHYSWGGYEYISRLLSLENEEGRPFAEYWLGAHPNHPSTVLHSKGEEKLDQFAERCRLPPLPYLLKVLDVRQMLSIQVHPDKASAEQGFEKENEEGIDLHASCRNYKDRNHKPELMVALSDFYLLHGFLEKEELLHRLESTNELEPFAPAFAAGGYKALCSTLFSLTQHEIETIAMPLVDRILPLYKSGSLNKSQPDFWAARAYQSFCENKKMDRGLFLIYFLNLVHLQKGEAIYQPPGMPHAYLEGQNIEIMANSDNVLRAGLTDKHVAIEELMSQLRFEATKPAILQQDGLQRRFAPPVAEFELCQHQIDSPASFETNRNETWLVTKGAVVTEGETLRQGEAVFFTGQHRVEVQPAPNAELFRAMVPGGGKN